MFPFEIKQEIITRFVQGVPISKLMKTYHVKGPATIYHWLERYKMFGIQGLMNSSKKTTYDYSFKIKVIKWRQEQQASYPVTAKYFKIKNPVTVWDWEKQLIAGRLNPRKRRSSSMKNQSGKSISKTLKQLQDENEILRARVAYLEKLEALAQKKSQTKRKPK